VAPAGLSKLRLGLLTLDVPDREVNVLTEDTLRELEDRLGEVERANFEGVLILSGKAKGFIAGADVEAIKAVRTEEEGVEASALGQRVMRQLSTLGVPTVAAIHGACVGGGAELACWCTARVASTDDATRIGFPEVKLGIVPGFGGTQRLPALVGLREAIVLATSGRLLTARDALRLGLVDSAVHRDYLLAEAASLADQMRRRGRRPVTRFHWSNQGLVRDVVTHLAEPKVARAAGPHYPAPAEALRLVRLSLTVPLLDGLIEESRTIGRLVVSPVARSLLHVHDLTRQAGKGGQAPPPGALVGTVGAGVMGHGIAGVAVASGFRARLFDVDANALARGVNGASDVVRNALRHAHRRDVATMEALDRLSWSMAFDGLARADLVVEAVVEREDVKRQVLAEIEAAVPPSCVIATNTSALSLQRLSSALKDPTRFVGLHFFNPVPKMPLVEVIRGPRTSEATLARALGWAQAVGKHPVVVADAAGFLVNRILMPYLAEAQELLGEGVSIVDVDAAARQFGMPMGPFRLLDEVGLDVAAAVARTFAGAFPGRFHESALLASLVEARRLGRKAGKGFYTYGRRGKEKPWRGLPAPTREMEPKEIQQRLFLRMADEGLRCLDEGVASRASDVDLATVFGMGFPPFLGGLLFWVERTGPARLLAQAETLRALCGERFEPSPRFRALAAGHSLDKAPAVTSRSA
jgi:3-hydroxyacyl-CoA dehydrogenase/enoyl-CoA hydratase/carnithine racemase